MSTQICTHNSVFHVDECLAIWMLFQLPEYKNAKVVRSRDPQVWSQSQILVDVGGEYDATTGRFDHHQRGFSETLSPRHSTKLSSAGLIYKHFGTRVIHAVISAYEAPTTDDFKMSSLHIGSQPKVIQEHWEASSNFPRSSSSLTSLTLDNDVNLTYWYVYKTFLEAIDAIDNGIKQFDGRSAYMISTDLSSRIRHMNVNLFQPPEYIMDEAELEARFFKAIQIVGQEFTESILYTYYHYLPGRSIIDKKFAEIKKSLSMTSVTQATQVAQAPTRVMILTKRIPSWKNHFLELEEQYQLQGVIWFMVFFDAQNNHWKIQILPVSNSNPKARKLLCEKWAGLDQAALVSGFWNSRCYICSCQQIYWCS